MTTETIYRIWRGDVHRWHHNPDWRLFESGDTIHKHQLRVATLGLLIFGDAFTRDDFAQAITHDTPESWFGDVSYLAKLEPIIRDAHKWAEAKQASELALPQGCSDRVKLCDGVDCILWAATRQADMNRDGWPDHIASVKGMAWRLGVGAEVEGMFSQAGVK